MSSYRWTSGGVSTAAGLHIYLYFRERSGGEPGAKEAVTTETAGRKYTRQIRFAGKHQTQRPGHGDSMGCALVSTSYTLMH